MLDKHQGAYSELDLGEIAHLIANEFCAAGTEKLPVVDPSTQQQLTEIPQATASEVDAAVNAAKKAQESWQKTAPRKRARAMNKLAESLKKRAKRFGVLEALDAGMPTFFSNQFSSKAMATHMRYYAEWADKVYGDVVPTGGAGDGMSIVTKEPVGVVASVIPWNTPCLFLGSKTAPALAAGCAVILKPSEQASLAAFEFATAVVEAGLPPGLVQVLFGGGATGAALCNHKDVNMVAFTGGGSRGREVMAAASQSFKRVSLELGGKSPHIIFEDADLNRAAMMAGYGVFSLTGQACAAGSRLFIHDSVYDEFLQKVGQVARTMKVGDPLSGSTQVGPLITPESRDRVHNIVTQAVSSGATLHMGGKAPADMATGGFYEPTILTDVDPLSEVAREEIFGPVLCAFRFSDTRSVIELANDTEFGLAAGLWTRDLKRAMVVSKALRAGTVWVNSYGNIPIQAPFGGFKQSGFCRHGGV
jgi:acyl-CoA reductase-like NAD-dependent aldehyde dehydrogenase